MTNIPFIYQYEEKENERAAAGYGTFGYLITRIEETLYDQYGVFYELYASDDPNTEYWELLVEDVRSGSLEPEHVAYIFEKLACVQNACCRNKKKSMRDIGSDNL